MKATILADGTLYVSPESTLEAYALRQWGMSNIASRDVAELDNLPKMTIDCRGHAGEFVTSTRPLRHV